MKRLSERLAHIHQLRPDLEGERGQTGLVKASGASRSVVKNMTPVPAAASDDPKFVKIPLVKLKLSAGITEFATEPDRRDGGTIGMRSSWVERHRYNPEYLYAITVCGDSMATTLHDGDIVVINVADQQWSMVRSTRSTTRVRQS